MRYLDHEIDPESVHISVNVPFMAHLEDLVQMAVYLAQRGKVVAISHDQDQVVADDGTVRLVDVIGYRDFEPDWFEKRDLLCPRDADLEWERQQAEAGNPRPRPFPSILVKPPKIPGAAAQLVVSKPSLCEGCVHWLGRALSGTCVGKAFTPLTEAR